MGGTTNGADVDVEGLEVRFLRVLVALAEEGTFTDAAVRLGVGQPAVSRTLARFEAVLDVRLVDRTTRSLRLTPAGQACYDASVEALAALAAVRSAARRTPRPLRLGYSWAAFGPWTSDVLARWHQAHPDVPLEVHRVDDRDAGLRTRAVDVTVRRGPVDDAGVAVVAIAEEGRLAAVPTVSPLAARTVLRLADLVDEVVVLAPAAGTTTLALWPDGQRPTRVREVGNTDEWLLAIASGGVGVTPASTPTQHGHPGVRFVPLAGVPPVTVSLVWPAQGAHPAVGAFLAVVRSVVGTRG